MYIIVREVDEYTGPKGNIVNISRRHCRIGKVTPKPPKHWRLLPDLSRTLPYPLPKVDRMPAPYWSGGYVPVTSSGDVPIVPSHGVC